LKTGFPYGTFARYCDHETSVQLSQKVKNQETCVVDVCLSTGYVAMGRQPHLWAP